MKRNLLLASLVLWSCSSNWTPAPTAYLPPEPSPTPTPSKPPSEPTTDFLLSDAPKSQPAGEAPQEKIGPSATTPLSEADTAKLLAKVPALPETPALSFSLREASLAPPKTGATVTGVFPGKETPRTPDAAPVVVEKKPLEVVRYQPQSTLYGNEEVSIAFSRPMVAITTLSALSEKEVPAKITPQPKGKWRWIGTKLLTFTPDENWPKATEFVVEVPAGIKSVNDEPLEKATKFSFRTEAARITGAYPDGDSVVHQPLIFFGFNQKVEPSKMMGVIHGKAGRAELSMRLATPEEIAKDNHVRRLYAAAPAGTAMVLALEKPLDPETKVRINVGPKIPSAEGPLTEEGGQYLEFETYGPLKVTDKDCGYRLRCEPYDSFYFEFNNVLDPKSLSETQIKVEPTYPKMKINVYSTSVEISGEKPLGRYKVTLPAGIKDVYGQTIEKEVSASFHVKEEKERRERRWDYLYTNVSDLVVLTPERAKYFPVHTTGMGSFRATFYEVTPEDWSKWRDWSYKKKKLPGKKVDSKIIRVNDKEKEGEGVTYVDLTDALPSSGVGHLLVHVESRGLFDERKDDSTVWVQVTNLGVDAFQDGSGISMFTSSLKDGAAIEGAEVTLTKESFSGKTDKDGIASFTGKLHYDTQLIAKKGDDSAFLIGFGELSPPARGLRWFITDGRNLYRPGEKVELKGWLRLREGGARGALQSAIPLTPSVSYTATDSLGNELGKGDCKLDENGGFTTSLVLPGTVNLGQVNFTFSAGDLPKDIEQQSHTFSVNVQEYRRPEYEVTVDTGAGPYFFGDTFIATATASYFAGGGLPDAEVYWRLQSREESFVPPNQSEFAFGASRHWSDPAPKVHTLAWSSKTKESGEHLLQIAYSKEAGFYPRMLSGAVRVMDVNRQTFNTKLSLVVHPASVYVGLKTQSPFTKINETLEVEGLAVNLDGDAVEGRPVSIEIGRIAWSEDYKQTLVEVEKCEKTSGKTSLRCQFTPKKAGLYQITASVKDDKGRESRSQLLRYVVAQDTGGQELVERKAKLLPNKEKYAPGETAELLVLSPFVPAEGILTLRHGGILETRRFTMKGSTITLPVVLEKGIYPAIEARVDLEGVAPLADKSVAPAFASATASLSIPPEDQALTVEVTPKEKELLPGMETSVSVALKDHTGKPVVGEAAVFVMDESLLALSGFAMPSPSDVFYASPADVFSVLRLREKIYLPGRQDLNEPQEATTTTSDYEYDTDGVATGEEYDKVVEYAAMEAPSAPRRALSGLAGGMKKMSPMRKEDAKATAAAPPPSGAGGASPNGQIALRSSFESTAFFAARAKTDEQGKTTLTYKLPDSLTRYRIMVVAASKETSFGTGESTVTARLPLMVRPSPPRFLLQGDQAEVSVVLQNQTDKLMPVEIALRASFTSLKAGKGYRIEIPANDRREIRFPLKALQVGKATLQVAASAGAMEDAAQLTLPIYTPATTEAFAMYGEIDNGAISQPIEIGEDVAPEFGGLTITTSSTALSSLTDAVIYLTSYPYECAEQLSSRILAIVALKDFLKEFKAEGLPSEKELNEAVERDIARLAELQHRNGGFAFFRREDEPWPYVSVHVTHALARAKAAGYAVPEKMLREARQYVDNLQYHFSRSYSDAEKDAITAYSIYVLSLLGETSPAKARQLFKKLDSLSLESIGWLLPSLSSEQVEAALKKLNGQVKETAGAAHFVDSYESGAYLMLTADRRADAILLEGLIKATPKNDLIPKLVAGLLAHRTAGRWASTQENVFVLVALKAYFDTYEKATPDFIARAWLGDAYAGDHTFKGRSTERYALQIPMSELFKRKKAPLYLSKEGTGRLYYRLGLLYAPKTMSLPPLDMGFTVERTYEAVDDPSEVMQGKDGTWTIKAGARVKVKLKMAAPATRYHVVLVDSMPAGFEAENPTLAATSSMPSPDAAPSWRSWQSNWYQHQNLRDERVEAFTTYLWEGVYSYSYTARATTPGVFVAPPAKAEEMYAPETFGRSALERVVVVE